MKKKAVKIQKTLMTEDLWIALGFQKNDDIFSLQGLHTKNPIIWFLRVDNYIEGKLLDDLNALGGSCQPGSIYFTMVTKKSFYLEDIVSFLKTVYYDNGFHDGKKDVKNDLRQLIGLMPE